MLSLLIVDGYIEEGDGNQDMIKYSGPQYVIIISRLLTKIIAIYVQFFII